MISDVKKFEYFMNLYLKSKITFFSIGPKNCLRCNGSICSMCSTTTDFYHTASSDVYGGDIQCFTSGKNNC
jgi:hypothetical protein